MSDAFAPTLAQSLAKAKFEKVLESRAVTVDAAQLALLTIEQLTALTGERRLAKWAAKDEDFLPWFLDKEDFGNKVRAMAEARLGKLLDIIDAPLEPKLLTAKDQLAALNMLFQLADKFPNKRKEITFLDREVARLNEDEVARQLALYDGKLAATGAAQDIVDVLPVHPSTPETESEET